jgi:NAD(P)-dependent dehydrogenase (short-subunit alcohol dehydrogenase family)
VNRKITLAIAAGAALALSRLPRRQHRFDFRGAAVLITGGSRGLGLELARLFAAEGASLALLARNAEGLNRARAELISGGAEVLIETCDIRDPKQVAKAVEKVMATYGRIDVLVNNAGIIQMGPFADMDFEDFTEAMAVHAWGPLHLVRSVLPHMQRLGSGRIVNIASVGGLVAIPHLLPYVTSKFALVGLSDGLRSELAIDNILVTTVAPGLMRTGSHVNALMKGRHRQEFAWFAIANALPLFSIDVRRAARRIVRACRYGDPKLIITPQARLAQLANDLLPGPTAAAFKLAARLLPAPAGPAGHQRRTGRESRSPLVPSLLTRLADRAISRQKEGD